MRHHGIHMIRKMPRHAPPLLAGLCHVRRYVAESSSSVTAFTQLKLMSRVEGDLKGEGVILYSYLSTSCPQCFHDPAKSPTCSIYLSTEEPFKVFQRVFRLHYITVVTIDRAKHREHVAFLLVLNVSSTEQTEMNIDQ